jgi:hypothetical protein
MKYDFKEQLDLGEKFEKELDQYFGPRYSISNVTMEQQRLGIDRIFKYEKEIGVEYKSDLQAHKTNNIFIETISSDKDFSEGWAVKSKADLLVYYLPIKKVAYLVEMSKLREKLPMFCSYKKASGKNNTYSSHGRLVPLDEFEKIAFKKINLEELK